MHETLLLKNIFHYLDKEERLSCRRIKKVHISLSEFGSINKEQFQEHYKRESSGTRWERLKMRIRKVPCGPELEITKLDFE